LGWLVLRWVLEGGKLRLGRIYDSNFGLLRETSGVLKDRLGKQAICNNLWLISDAYSPLFLKEVFYGAGSYAIMIIFNTV
jgi:hypothetical protein